MILRLAAPLGSFGLDLCRLMDEHDRRFGFIPMLSSRTRAAGTSHFALGEEFIQRQLGGVTVHGSVSL